MSSTRRRSPKWYELPALYNGDCMTQREFHRIYEKMPDDYKAELLGGTVFVCEPLGRPHGKHHVRLGSILDAYEAMTPGVEVCDNVTVMLGEEDEVQPDLFLRILPECKGQSADTQQTRRGKKKYGPFVKGAPELVAEIAHSSRAIDLHLKRQRYVHAGVLEYLVLCLEPLQIVWFELPGGKMLEPDPQGVFRSNVFPGLWIDGDALLELDYPRSMEALTEGVYSPEHAAFVELLAARLN